MGQSQRGAPVWAQRLYAPRHARIAQRFLVSLIQEYIPAAVRLRRWADGLVQLEQKAWEAECGDQIIGGLASLSETSAEVFVPVTMIGRTGSPPILPAAVRD